MAHFDGGVVAFTWPAELVPQAKYLYADGRELRLLQAADEGGWEVDMRPHLAFRNSRPEQRLYPMDWLASVRDAVGGGTMACGLGSTNPVRFAPVYGPGCSIEALRPNEMARSSTPSYDVWVDGRLT